MIDPEIRKIIDELRKTRQTVNPNQVYRLNFGDDTFYECTGQDLINTAEAQVALADAVESGDKGVIQRAFERLDETLED